MDKAEAIKILKDFYDESAIFSVRTALETLHPELKESEDEKIRKTLIRVLNENVGNGIEKYGAKLEEALAWLEKQEGCEHIKKDWLEHIKQSWYKEGFIDGKYSGGTSKEWTINDAATLKELIDFLENGTTKLQHDLTRYANWLKIQFTPIEKQGQPRMQYGITINGVEYELIEDNEADECERCALKGQCNNIGDDTLCNAIFGSDIVAHRRFEKITK